MKQITTESGSIYLVNGNMIRRVRRSPTSESERIKDEWREAQSISTPRVGHPMLITWGTGKDEVSDSAKVMIVGNPDAEGGIRVRITHTSPVASIGEPSLS